MCLVSRVRHSTFFVLLEHTEFSNVYISVGGTVGVQPLQETSDYMELNPRQPEHITGSSEYHSLSVKPQKDPEAYENVNFQTRPKENGNDGEIYEYI